MIASSFNAYIASHLLFIVIPGIADTTVVDATLLDVLGDAELDSVAVFVFAALIADVTVVSVVSVAIVEVNGRIVVLVPSLLAAVFVFAYIVLVVVVVDAVEAVVVDVEEPATAATAATAIIVEFYFCIVITLLTLDKLFMYASLNRSNK